nr:MAG TPA: hypothetical protein [Bacteriophage sp.]
MARDDKRGVFVCVLEGCRRRENETRRLIR